MSSRIPSNGTTAIEPDTEDEILIDAVSARRALWDHTVDLSQRRKFKKNALWLEVSNILGGRKTPTDIKKRWQYLRDCYMKAKKKMQAYVPSGSGGNASHPAESTFRHYRRMQFLQPSLDNQVTVNSLPLTFDEPSIEDPLAFELDQTTSDFPDQNTSSLDTASGSTTSRTRTTSSSSSCSTSKSKKRPADVDEMEAEFLKYLKESQPKRDAVDSFLEQLGDILRRLPYIQRRNFQLRILTQAIEEKDKVQELNN